MNEPKKQHYVPQTYLRKFSFSNSPPHKIFVLHKDKSKIFCSNVCDTASERHFYTVNKSNDKYIWENWYSKAIEPLLSVVQSEVISKCDNVLIQSKSFILTSEMKLQLAITMICQLLRGKQSREIEYKIYSEALPSVIEKAREQFAPIDELKEKILKTIIEDDDYFKITSMQATFDIKRLKHYSNILFQRNFLVYKIIGESNFITSDNPVMFLNTTSLNAMPFSNGLVQGTTAIYFPIAPKLLIAAYHPNLYCGALAEYDGKLLFLDSHKDRAFIQTQNKKQYEQCYNQVYAQSRTVLEMLF